MIMIIKVISGNQCNMDVSLIVEHKHQSEDVSFLPTGITLLQEHVVKNTCPSSLLVSFIATSSLIRSCNCNRQSDAIFKGAWYNCHRV